MTRRRFFTYLVCFFEYFLANGVCKGSLKTEFVKEVLASRGGGRGSANWWDILLPFSVVRGGRQTGGRPVPVCEQKGASFAADGQAEADGQCKEPFRVECVRN